MRKLRLDLDALAVDTFDTQGATKGKGTVLAEQASTYYTLCVGPCAYTYDDPTCPACPTCAESCNGTCDATCEDTCGISCHDTCRPRLCGPYYPEPY